MTTAEAIEYGQFGPRQAVALKALLWGVQRHVSGAVDQASRSTAQAIGEALMPVVSMLGEILEKVDRGRKDPTQDTCLDHENYLRISGGKQCPSCRRPLFGDGGALLPDAHFDHQDGNAQNNADDNFWILCAECHGRKTRGTLDERSHFVDLFRVYRRGYDRFLTSSENPRRRPDQTSLADQFRPGRRR